MTKFLTSTYFIIPLMMISFGLLWRKYPPKKRNLIYGYRTYQSLKSEETWKFAHQYQAKIWLYGGAILMMITIFTELLKRAYHFGLITVQAIALFLIFLQVLIVVISYIITERELYKNFDKDGKRINLRDI